MSNLDEVLEELLRKKWDFGYRVQKLFEAPVETLGEEELEEFLVELKEVGERISKCLPQARLKCLRSLPEWERRAEMFDHVIHRMLANPHYLKLLSLGIFEDRYDNLLQRRDS